LIFHETGAAMTPHYTGKKNKEYCYYVSTDYLKVRHTAPSAAPQRLAAALQDFDSLWTQLFHNERARIVQPLVQRVTVTGEGLAIDLRADGLKGLARELMTQKEANA